MNKRFIDFYLEALTKNGNGGGSGTLAPYKPVDTAGYLMMPLRSNYSMNLSTVKNRTTSTNWYGALPATAPSVGDKVCFYGVADDDGDKAPFAVWGILSEYTAYSAYCRIKFSAYHGASYIEDGVQTVVGGGSFESDGNDNLTVDAVATLYPIKPPASLGYKEMAVTQNLTLTNLKNYWNNKNTNAQYRTALDDTLASGDKVLLVGYATDSGKTWPFALWGTVNTTVKYSSYMYVKLATYDGLSIMKLDSTYDSIVGETHIYENGTYAADSGDSIEVNVSGGGTQPVLVNKTVTANGTYNASSDNADGYDKVVVNVPSSGDTLSEFMVNGSRISSSGAEGVVTGATVPMNMAFCDLYLKTLSLPTVSQVFYGSFCNIKAVTNTQGAVISLYEPTGFGSFALQKTSLTDFVSIPCFANSTIKELRILHEEFEDTSMVSCGIDANSATLLKMALDRAIDKGADACIRVQDDYVNTYKNATNWSTLASYIRGLSD